MARKRTIREQLKAAFRATPLHTPYLFWYKTARDLKQPLTRIRCWYLLKNEAGTTRAYSFDFSQAAGRMPEEWALFLTDRESGWRVITKSILGTINDKYGETWHVRAIVGFYAHRLARNSRLSKGNVTTKKGRTRTHAKRRVRH